MIELRGLRNYSFIKNAGNTASQSGMMMDYEKYKLQICANSFMNLAGVLSKNFEEANETNEDRGARLVQQCLKEQRNLMADNLQEVADMMKRVAQDRVKFSQFGEKKRKQIVQLLFMEGLSVKEVYLLENEKGYLEIGISLRDRKNQNLISTDIGGLLSVILNRRLEPTKETLFFVTDEFQNMFFREEAKYYLLTGIAKAIKENEKVSGDNYSFLEIDNYHFVGMISDGMGSGEKASKDSEMVIDLTEKLLEAGFSTEGVVHMVNDILLVTPEMQNMSTLDICDVNLYTGECQLTKVGAASTYLKRGDVLEKISTSSLPFGMFHPMTVETISRELRDGDYIILFSDGVIDEIEEELGEECLRELLREIDYKSPGEVANLIMKYVLSVKQGRIRDDMTILVMGMWEK